MEKVLKEITVFVNQCLGLLGVQPEPAPDFLSGFLGLDDSTWSNIQAIVMQLIATILLFIIVRVFLWKKVTNLIEKRQELVNKTLNDAKEDSAKARRLALLKDEEYQNAKLEARRIIEEAVKEGNLTKDQIIKEAKEECNRRLANAKEEIEMEVQKSRKEIKDAIVDIAFKAAEKIVKHEIDKESNKNIVKEFIEEVGEK